MDFEYTDYLYVEEYDLEEMVKMCKKGATPEKALDEVSRGWDDCDFYIVEKVEDQIIAEIERRLAQATK